MRMKNTCFIPTILLGLSTLFLAANPALSQSAPTEGISKIHEITSTWDDGAAIAPSALLATNFGLLRALPSGVSTRISGLEAVVTALASLPGEPQKLLLSGYSKDKTALGVMKSEDGGKTWQDFSLQTTNGAEPVALRSLAISSVDPNFVVGIMDGLELSRDGGKTWQASGKLPEKTFKIAPSSLDTNTIFAATMTGLKKTTDLGATWSDAYPSTEPTTVVSVLGNGRVLAFVFGTGLVAANESDLKWQTLSANFESRYLLNIDANPNDANQLIATADTGAILISSDGGDSWTSFEGSDNASLASLARGKQIFEGTCQACHGTNGIGEDPGNPSARDEFGFKAPALNNDTHAWHHSDAAIKMTVQNGSSRNSRMVAFKDTFSDQDINSVIAYIKTFWTLNSLACQGGRHGGCLGK
ncbi:MAG: c-type cytochrome [Alphaproteobacteria bacterium]|nr:c-type cytochrome [Alphaproteobacteria bacterium]